MNLTASSTKTNAFLAMVFALGALAVQPAEAGVSAGGFTRSSTVTDIVANNGNGTWTYNYTVNNTSQFTAQGLERTPLLVDWELPWFGDAGIDIASIISPNGWAVAIETIGVANAATGWEGIASWQDPSDPFFAGAGSPFTTVTQVLHWYSECFLFRGDREGCFGGSANGILAPGSLSGFSFVAAFDETDAPYQASWAVLPVRTGDPAFPLGGIPNSPRVQGLVQGVPEPGLLGLLGIGLVAAMLGRRRRA